jgi:hypothetical protein
VRRLLLSFRWGPVSAFGKREEAPRKVAPVAVSTGRWELRERFREWTRSAAPAELVSARKSRSRSGPWRAVGNGQRAFLPLHGLQAGRRFASRCRPPLLSGFTWSHGPAHQTVRASDPAATPPRQLGQAVRRGVLADRRP